MNEDMKSRLESLEQLADNTHEFLVLDADMRL